jgi:superfamily I DNA/RNA helicase
MNDSPAVEPESREKSESEGELNPEQQEAASHCGTALIIVAGPGTGKTRTLTHRIADLIQRKKAAPGSILALTFTRKAADEMRHRLRYLLSGAADLPVVSTFHALCLQILQEIDPEIPLTVIDDVSRLAMLRQAILQVHPAVDVKPARLERMIVEHKQLLRSPEACLASAPDPRGAALAAVYAAYQKILEIQKLYDYEDLIFQVIDRFTKREELRRRYLQRYGHILVDEYQDLNHAQYQLIRSLTTDRTALFVIGDPNQAIYGFRGADVRYFQHFLQDYPAARKIRLQRNYRSSEMILTASHRVITASGNATPAVRSGIHENRPIELIECTSERSEAVAVGLKIEQLVGGTGFHSHDFGRPGLEATDAFGFNDIAVLFRTRAQGPLLLKVLQSAGIPCQHVDKSDAFQQEGKRVLQSGLHLVRGTGSYMDLVAFSEAAQGGCSADALQPFIFESLSNNRSVSEALQAADRMPIPGMKTRSQRKLTALARTIETLRKQFDRCEVSFLLSALIDRLKSSFIHSHPNLRDPDDIVFKMARESGRDLEGFLLRWALAGDADAYDAKAQKVSLLTFHAAKGLEFPVVFITGCEEELLPLVPFADETDTDVEEERRLLYVAMTRARKALFLTWAERRTVHGRVQPRRQSRFIDAIPKNLLQVTKSHRRPAVQRQLTLF